MLFLMKPRRLNTPAAWLGLAICSVALGQDPEATTQPARKGVADTPVTAGFLVLEGVYNSELMAPWDIFHHTIFHTNPGMRVLTVGREAGEVRTFEGLILNVQFALEDAPEIDVLVVPSAVNNMDTDLDDERLIRWISERGRSARYVLSLCDGAFLLAEAGLLDGRRCTTFPGDIAAFRRRFDGLTVVEGVSFVADGPAITGVGGARSYDPALYLVERLYGENAARGVARGMVLDWDDEKIRHLALRGADRPACYLPGDRVDSGVTVEDADGRPVRLADVIASRPDAKAIVLAILGGAEAQPVAARGGLWCEDSFSEIANLRHLRLRYGPQGVLFVGVLCPPVHHERRYGYDEGAFRSRPGQEPVYQRNRRRFVEACRQLDARVGLPFDVVLFDPRLALLTPADSAAPSWQGRFKWFEDDQTYGTPTTWVLTPALNIPGPPFCRNVYESEGRKLRYRPDDLSGLLDRVIAP